MSIYAPSWCDGRRGSMKSLSILLFTCLALVVSAGCSKTESTAAAAGSGAPSGKGGGGRRGGGDVPVTIATVGQKNVPVEIQVIGNVEAYATISLKAQVTGQITKASFNEGAYVKKDDPLFTIDQRPLEAALKQAQANLSRDE